MKIVWKSFGNRLEFRLQAVRFDDPDPPPEGGTPNDFQTISKRFSEDQ
jgi:hypothetical protein